MVVCALAVLHPRADLRRATQGGSTTVPWQDSAHAQLHRQRTLLLAELS